MDLQEKCNFITQKFAVKYTHSSKQHTLVVGRYYLKKRWKQVASDSGTESGFLLQRLSVGHTWNAELHRALRKISDDYPPDSQTANDVSMTTAWSRQFRKRNMHLWPERRQVLAVSVWPVRGLETCLFRSWRNCVLVKRWQEIWIHPTFRDLALSSYSIQNTAVTVFSSKQIVVSIMYIKK
jgi:hypothetical protein